MIQCFVKKEYEAPFGLTQPPRLFSVSRTDEKASAHPRVMHAHDDLVEVVLVRGGESRYFVGGKPYDARRGDLFIFNSRVVHDEPSGPDRPVATSSLALGGLQVPGLRENALIPDNAPPVCRLPEAQTVRLERLYDVLYDELTAGNDDGAHHLLMAILTLVQQFRAALAEGHAADVGVFAQRIKDYIDRHFAEEFSLQQMADALHVSPYYLAHVCKETSGLLAAAIRPAPPHRRGADPADHNRPAGYPHRRAGGLRQPQPLQRPVFQGRGYAAAHLPPRVCVPQIRPNRKILKVRLNSRTTCGCFFMKKSARTLWFFSHPGGRIKPQ